MFLVLCVNSFAQNNVTITGKVNYNFPEKYILSEHVFLSYLKNFCSVTPDNKIFFYPSKDTVPDSFSISCFIPYSTPADIQIDKYGMRIYIESGDNLHLVLDLNEKDYQTHFTGKGAERNNYLVNQYFNKGKSFNPFKQIRKDYKRMTLSYFYIYCDSVYKVWNYYLDTLSRELKQSNFYDYAINEVEYEIGCEQYSFLKSHFKERMLAGEQLGPDSTYYWFLYDNKVKSINGVNDGTFSTIKNDLVLKTDNQKATNCGWYFRFLDNYLNDLMPEYNADPHFKIPNLENLYIHQYRIAKNQFTNKVKDVMLGRILISAFSAQEENYKAMDSLINDYQSTKPDTSCLNIVLARYKDYQKLIKGAPAPDFSFTNQHGNKKSLSDFKGKVVYIVAFSSFNVPSLNEMNSLSLLQEHFANKNVALIYISFDNSKKDWEGNVKQFKIEGEQYLIGVTNKANEFSNLYNIKNFPQCILIDKKGNIISINAHRPSQGIEGDIEELLNNN